MLEKLARTSVFATALAGPAAQCARKFFARYLHVAGVPLTD